MEDKTLNNTKDHFEKRRKEKGMMDFTLNEEAIAKICHEANKALCEVQGDSSQPAWEDAPEWQRTSAINGVKARLSGEIDSPEMSHDNWMLEKFKDGWKWGPEKDPASKQHPCLVPYKDLPPGQKVKDSLFCGIVDVLGGPLA